MTLFRTTNLYWGGCLLSESQREYDQFSPYFRLGELIEPQEVANRTETGSRSSWAPVLQKLADEGLLRCRSKGIRKDGQDAEYELINAVFERLSKTEAERAKRHRQISAAMTVAIKQMIRHFKDDEFTRDEASLLTNLSNGALNTIISHARLKGWMPIRPGKGKHHFILEAVPLEWLEGENNDVGSAGKNNSKTPKVQAAQYAAMIKLLILQFWREEFRARDVEVKPSFKKYMPFDSGELLIEACAEGYLINQNPGRDTRRSYKVNRSARKVQRLAMEVGVLPGDDKIPELLTVLNRDAEAREVLFLEIERLSQTKEDQDGWLAITNGVANAIRQLNGWKSDVAHDLLLEMTLAQFASKNGTLLEVRTTDDGSKQFKPRLTGISVAPTSTKPATADQPEEVDTTTPPETATAAPMAATTPSATEEVPVPAPATKLNYGQMAKEDDGVRKFLLNIIHRLNNGNWVYSSEVCAEFKKDPRFRKASPQGIGVMFKNFLAEELIEAQGQLETRQYRLISKGLILISVTPPKPAELPPARPPTPSQAPASEPEVEVEVNNEPQTDIPDEVLLDNEVDSHSTEEPVPEETVFDTLTTPEAAPMPIQALASLVEEVALIDKEEARLRKVLEGLALKRAALDRKRSLHQFASDNVETLIQGINVEAKTPEERTLLLTLVIQALQLHKP